MQSVSKDVLDAAIARVDRMVARAIARGGVTPQEASAEAEAWTVCRRELRMRRAQSERAVPAIANAAQNFAQARKELDKGLERLGEVASPPPDEDR